MKGGQNGLLGSASPEIAIGTEIIGGGGGGGAEAYCYVDGTCNQEG